MTNAPETRKTHVIRILGTNRAGEVLQDIWADVERMDEAKSVYQVDGSFQGIVRRFKWLDDPDDNNFNEDGPSSRKLKIVKVCSPDEDDLNDPEEWIPIPAITGMRSQDADQGKQVRLLNEELTEARIVENRRILHYDTNIDSDAQAAFDADSERKVYVVPGDQYTRDDATKDEDQYIEHQVIKFLKHRVNDETRTGVGNDQGKQTKLLNQYLIDESEEAKLEEKGTNDVNPPYRLDPYQNIINIQLKTGSPKYCAVTGYGVLMNVLLFSVDEDDDSLKTVTLKDPLDFNGFPTFLSISRPPGWHDNEPSPETASVHDITWDWKGNVDIGSTGNLYVSALADVEPPQVPYTAGSVYMDYAGESVRAADYNKFDPKGALKNGLWCFSRSVSKYNGETLVWKRENWDVYEVLSGGRVLAYDDVAGYGVFTLDLTDGTTKEFKMIGDGFIEPEDENTSFMSEVDTDQAGNTYASFFDFEDGPDGLGVGTTTIKKIDIKGETKWERELDGITELPRTLGVFDLVQRKAGVCESKNGKVYVIVTDTSQGRIIGWSDDFFYDYEWDSLVRVLDGETGQLVRRTLWGTNHATYFIDAGAEDTDTEDQFYGVGQRLESNLASGAQSSPRFPSRTLAELQRR